MKAKELVKKLIDIGLGYDVCFFSEINEQVNHLNIEIEDDTRMTSMPQINIKLL